MAQQKNQNEPELTRFGVSMEPELLARFDAELAKSGYSCRSKALRDMVRARLAEGELAAGDARAVGVLSFVYNHDQHDLARRIQHLGHERHTEVVSSLHVHLDARSCLEVIILRGRADRLRALADRLIATRGVRHARLSLSPARCPLSSRGDHNNGRTRKAGLTRSHRKPACGAR